MISYNFSFDVNQDKNVMRERVEYRKEGMNESLKFTF